MALVFYARVSSKDQNLARQLTRAKEIKADKVFTDKYSGKNLDRPALKQMMEYLREGDTLEVVSLDRLSRDYNDLKELVQSLRKMKVRLIVDDLPQAHTNNELVDQFMMDMMIQLMGFVAQNEREKIKERQVQGIKIAKQRGAYKGGTIKYGRNSKDPKNRLVWQTVIEMLYNRKENPTISGIARKVGISRQQVYRIKQRENL
ncbi:MAG: recombinase family protein [Acinetobacter sp.]|uniref:recombinase family protein n=1 Tax=Lactobacillus helveticus TaxID=1587 RepID=UPI00156205A8|nr:recombinase family protein [Lactobacillus helveticus]MDN5650753.1 recombinase family protein [Acinetobacter sp.]MDN6024352.1 recombinase family protein [Lactobacillus sp.]MDN6055135.1 recombinase family protein [Lactococcus lactis]MCO0807316.1 recombinase family protein [Lactobacillus helveticus]NRO39544.1 putative DNA-invertase [Lactobacillus helveticus]